MRRAAELSWQSHPALELAVPPCRDFQRFGRPRTAAFCQLQCVQEPVALLALLLQDANSTLVEAAQSRPFDAIDELGARTATRKPPKILCEADPVGGPFVSRHHFLDEQLHLHELVKTIVLRPAATSRFGGFE